MATFNKHFRHIFLHVLEVECDECVDPPSAMITIGPPDPLAVAGDEDVSEARVVLEPPKEPEERKEARIIQIEGEGILKRAMQD
jgi:hypothetical protein